jgi:hypothetical protein
MWPRLGYVENRGREQFAIGMFWEHGGRLEREPPVTGGQVW